MNNCQDCLQPFTNERPYHAKSRCTNCYIKMWQKEKRSYNKRPKEVTTCIDCNISIGQKNKKGKLCDVLIKRRCRSCYSKWNRNQLCLTCEKCGVQFITGSSACLCLSCRPKSRYSGKTIKRKDLSVEQFSTMLTLFRRYKTGTNTPVDNFRVVDLYLDIFESQSFVYNSSIGFDGYEEESQVVLMLRSLKKIYDAV